MNRQKHFASLDERHDPAIGVAIACKPSSPHESDAAAARAACRRPGVLVSHGVRLPNCWAEAWDINALSGLRVVRHQDQFAGLSAAAAGSTTTGTDAAGTEAGRGTGTPWAMAHASCTAPAVASMTLA